MILPYRFVFCGLHPRYGEHRNGAVEALQQRMANLLRLGLSPSIDPLVGRVRRGSSREASAGCLLSGWLHRPRSLAATNGKPERPPGCRPVAQRSSTLPRKHQGMATDRSPRGMDVRRMGRSGKGCSRKGRSDGGEATCPTRPSPRFQGKTGCRRATGSLDKTGRAGSFYESHARASYNLLKRGFMPKLSGRSADVGSQLS